MLDHRRILLSAFVLSGIAFGTAHAETKLIRGIELHDLRFSHPTWLSKEAEVGDLYDSYAFRSAVAGFEIMVSHEPLTAKAYLSDLVESYEPIAKGPIETSTGEEVVLCDHFVTAQVIRFETTDDVGVVQQVYDLPANQAGEPRLLLLQKFDLDGLPSDERFDEMWKMLRNSLRCGR